MMKIVPLWGGVQAVLLGTEQHQPEMDDADSELEGSTESVYHPA